MQFSNLETQGEREPPPIQERLRRLPGALLLTAGYCASRVPAISELIRRLD
jgi:hypothetical protein